MKKNRLKLADLKVNSFITLSETGTSKTIKGGVRQPIDSINPGDTALCGPTPATHCFECPAN